MTDMTDQELDRLMRHVLMDGIGQEVEQTSQQDIPAFQPSPRYQRQMAAMQRDPLAWSRKSSAPPGRSGPRPPPPSCWPPDWAWPPAPPPGQISSGWRWSGTTRILSITTQVLTCLVKCRSIQFPLYRMGTKRSYAT